MSLLNNMTSFFNGKTQNKEVKPTIINQDEELAKQNTEIQNWIKENGQNFAQNLSWKNDENINLFPPVIFVKESYQALVNNVGSVFEKNLQIFKTIYNKYHTSFGGNTVAEKDTSTEIQELETERDKVMTEATKNHDDSIAKKEKREKELDNAITNNRKNLNTKKKWNLRPYYIKFFIGISIIATGELLINSDTFLYMNFDPTIATLIGLSVSAVIFMIGFGQASVIRSRTMSLWQKIGISIGFSVAVLSLFLVLGYARASLTNNNEAGDGLFQMLPFHFVGISTAFYIAIAVCKAYFYPPVDKLKANEAYHAEADQLKANLKEQKQLQKEIANGYKSRSQKRQSIKKGFGKDINPLTKSIKTENSAIRESALSFNRELAIAKNFYKQANADCKKNVASLVNTINLYKNADASTLPMTEVTNLENPFDGITLLVVTPPKVTPSPSVPVAIKDNGITSEPEQSAWEIMTEAQSKDTTRYSFINNNSKK